MIAGLLALGVVTTAAQEETVSDPSGAIGQIAKLPEGVLTRPELKKLINAGEKLFKTKFTIDDGAGRPGATQAIIPTKARHRSDNAFKRLPGPDAAACSSCHNDPVVGGAGDFVTNVFVSEGFSNADFDTSDPQFSNERGTNHLFGAGLLELLAREMTSDLHALRKEALEKAATSNEAVRVDLVTKGVSFGRLTALPDGLVDLRELSGVDTDLVIRPFSQKGVMTSLRQFTINALNHHHGMQPSERFGKRWTASDDFDEDGKTNELGAADISALVAWQATLPIPQQTGTNDLAQAGKRLLGEFGCTNCHIEALPLRSLLFSDPGPLDASGTLNTSQVSNPGIYDIALLDWAKTLEKNAKGEFLVPLFGDLKRHKMTDRSVNALGNELLSQRFVGRDIFMTSELWGIGSTAPYGHRNDFSTLDQIILAHGGDARKARDSYKDATREDRRALIAYLKTLVIKP